MKFKVTDPKGIHHGGKHLQPGDTLTSEPPHGAHVNTFLHFRQISPVTEKPKVPAESDGEKAAREKGAAEAAEAKAKADAEAAAAEAKAKEEAEAAEAAKKKAEEDKKKSK